ncbi:aldose epimerase family protein [Hydrogenophaga aquatica]
MPALLDPHSFAGLVDGCPVSLYFLRNDSGMTVAITNMGAKIMQAQVPDRHGQPGDVALGYGGLNEVLAGSPSLGAFVAPYAGRIAGARFTLDGHEYRLGANEGQHCLHGGPRGSRHQAFDMVTYNDTALVLRLRMPAQETGFPGTLALRLTYRLGQGNELLIEHEATCEGLPTPASFTSHGYFNLGLPEQRTIDGHWLQVLADETLATTPDNVPTGERHPVVGTALDLRRPRELAESGAFDHAYVLQPAQPGQLRLCARLGCEATGRVMETWSTEPVMQLYTGDKLGLPHGPRMGVCLEPQQFPNAPHCPGFPLNLVAPGRPYRAVTAYRFIVT